MSTGYICILSCEKEPDSIALYCTEYRPESAIKRLNTKLSSTFYIEFHYCPVKHNPAPLTADQGLHVVMIAGQNQDGADLSAIVG